MTERRSRAVFWGLVASLVAGVGLAYAVLLGREPGGGGAAAVGSAERPAAPVGIVVVARSGDVTIVRGGVPAPAAPGDALQADDALVTGPGARVELSGGSFGVVLEESGRFDVKEITAELSRFRLDSGLVSARVSHDPTRALEIAGADAVTRTTGGDVSVAHSGRVVAVGVRSGAAEFTSAGHTVTVRGGEGSTALAGKPPSAAAPLPASLLLEVSWPAERTTNQRKIVVTGRTAPGTVLLLGDARVDVQPDGRFTHVIVLHEGAQRLAARARAVGGLEARADGPAVVLDTRAPDAQFDTHDLWGTRGR